MLRKLPILVFFLTCVSICYGQANNYKIISRDVVNFWEAMDSLKPGCDTVAIFQQIVIDRASTAFNVFIRKWRIRAADYAYQVRRYPGFYKTLRDHSFRLIRAEDSIRAIVKRFKDLYPGFKDADICIGFGNFSTGGNIEISGNKNLVYIGLEYHGLDSGTDISELNISTRDYVSRSNFFRTIIHELVHIQQRTHGKHVSKNYNGNLLVNRVLSEGISDFIGQLIVDYGNNGNHYDYGLLYEEKLKMELKADLWKTGYGHWFGGDDSLFADMPRDLGYFMGSRIARSYYLEKNLNKSDLSELIEIRNLETFIKESWYF